MLFFSFCFLAFCPDRAGEMNWACSEWQKKRFVLRTSLLCWIVAMRPLGGIFLCAVFTSFWLAQFLVRQNKRRGQTKVFPLLLIPLLFLAAVRRFLSESYTDMPRLPGYDWIDVSVWSTVRKLFANQKMDCTAPLLRPLKGRANWYAVTITSRAARRKWSFFC